MCVYVMLVALSMRCESERVLCEEAEVPMIAMLLSSSLGMSTE